MEKELFQAAKEGNLKEFRRLVESGAANPTLIRSNHYDMTALHCACYRGSVNIVQYLVLRYLRQQAQEEEEEKQPDAFSDDEEDESEEDVINVGDCYGITPLHYATSCRSSHDRLTMVKMLVERANANVEATDDRQETPLHAACRKCHFDVVRYLVEHANADVNAGRESNNSPLHIALQRHQRRTHREECVAYLVPLCTIDARALDLVWKHNFPWKIKSLILNQYAKQNLGEDTFSATAPLHAILRCPLPSVEALMECVGHYPDLTVLDKQGRLALHVAIEEAKATRSSVLSPAVVLTLFRLEPRAALLKDPMTGFYPFEAAVRGNDGEEEGDWLNAAFCFLQQLDPETWMRSRGIGDTIIDILNDEDDPSRCLPGLRRRPKAWFAFRTPSLSSSFSRGERSAVTETETMMTTTTEVPSDASPPPLLKELSTSSLSVYA